MKRSDICIETRGGYTASESPLVLVPTRLSNSTKSVGENEQKTSHLEAHAARPCKASSLARALRLNFAHPRLSWVLHSFPARPSVVRCWSFESVSLVLSMFSVC